MLYATICAWFTAFTVVWLECTTTPITMYSLICAGVKSVADCITLPQESIATKVTSCVSMFVTATSVFVLQDTAVTVVGFTVLSTTCPVPAAIVNVVATPAPQVHIDNAQPVSIQDHCKLFICGCIAEVVPFTYDNSVKLG